MYGKGAIQTLEKIILTGLAIVIPLLLTLYFIWFVIGRIRQSLGPVVGMLETAGVIGFFRRRALIAFLLETGVYTDVIGFLSEIIAILLFLFLIVAVGAVARYRYGEALVNVLDYLIASIPGIGTVYQTLRRVGNLVLGDDVDNFEAVKLVEMLSEDTYLIAFQTAAPPDAVDEATGSEEMITLFVPMAPNPVTGGFLVYVPRDRVFDVDLTVDDAVRAILTSGLATEEADQFGSALTTDNPSPGIGAAASEFESVGTAADPSVLGDLLGSVDADSVGPSDTGSVGPSDTGSAGSSDHDESGGGR
ncbi:DUF502 domain-containing protein [Halorubrum sp. CSM-61]|uniref:DUF502 domain-containing protein n=1 Tax=Halorubrum sp. CSM-61 TaxID=2485838 RepID=UPI000F4D27B6|nr:DUF502 domain-containing protein [Halorubrum sp. CSM-61]